MNRFTPVSKRLVADFEQDLGIDPDNLEGMTFGPTLPDGRVLLIVVSDNNFNPFQTTQFIALAVELDTVALSIDDLEPVDPWMPRGIRVDGTAGFAE